VGATWTDLVDPTLEELREHAPRELEESALALLLAKPAHEDEPRPTLQGHGEYVFGVFLAAIAAHEEDLVYYQEIDIVLTHETLLTVRKTPKECGPFDIEDPREAVRPNDSTGMIVYRMLDKIAEQYLDLVDDVDEEIDELEEGVEKSSAEETRERISHLRHELLRIRRTLTPMRDAVRRVVDDVVEVESGPEVFPHEVEVEVAFNGAYDKFLRATDGLDLSRDLLAGVRDYLQAKIANDQNEVMKKLTVIASLLLVPTFIVGVYGQNFKHNFPETKWRFGYEFSWTLIIVTTLLQLWFYRRKRWI
jgi:magnesium transporter